MYVIIVFLMVSLRLLIHQSEGVPQRQDISEDEYINMQKSIQKNFHKYDSFLLYKPRQG